MNNDPIEQMHLEEMRRVVEHDKLKNEARGALEKHMRSRVPVAYRGGQILPLIFYPDARLKMVSKPVTEYNRNLSKLTLDAIFTMYSLGGVGLAAIQVGVLERWFVADWGEARAEAQVVVNPTILLRNNDVKMIEACLSAPGARLHVTRPGTIKVQYQDIHGNPIQKTLDGWPARIFQHELDHLDGKMHFDSANRLERQMALKKAGKMLRGELKRP